jgi:hypothetical protein
VFQRVRDRLSYANVMATLALFLALGGAAYAISIPNNSIDSKNIVNNSIKPPDIANLKVLNVSPPVLVPTSEQKTLAHNGPISIVAKCNQLMVGSNAMQALLVVRTAKAHTAAGTSSPNTNVGGNPPYIGTNSSNITDPDMNAGDNLAIADTGGVPTGGPVFDWGSFAANSPSGKGLQGIGSAAIGVAGPNKCSFTLSALG